MHEPRPAWTPWRPPARPYVHRRETLTGEGGWDPAAAAADEWLRTVDSEGRVRYWPAATLRQQGALADA